METKDGGERKMRRNFLLIIGFVFCIGSVFVSSSYNLLIWIIGFLFFMFWLSQEQKEEEKDGIKKNK